MSVVVVSGLPGSGKTTLALALGRELRLPVISKDQIKEVLADALALDEDASRSLGQASMQVMYALAERAPAVLLETFFWPGTSEQHLLALGRPLVQVYCDCPPSLARQRFDDRVQNGDRHRVHGVTDDWDRFLALNVPLDLSSPLLRVDTSRPVDVRDLANHVRQALEIAA